MKKKSLKKIAKGCFGAAVVLVLLWCVISVVIYYRMSPDERAKFSKKMKNIKEKRAAKKAKEARAFLDVLLKIRGQMDVETKRRAKLKIKACPVPKGGREVFPVDSYFFSQFFPDKVKVRKLRNHKKWAFLRTPVLRKLQKALDGAEPFPGGKLKEPKMIYALAGAQRKLKGKYLGVFRPLKVSWPVIHEKSRRYSRGFYFGWLFVYDIDSAKRVCQTTLIVRNSKKIKAKSLRIAGVKLGGSATKAVEKDFVKQFRKESGNRLKSITKQLQLKFP